MSKDPNTQVGAVIVGPDKEIRTTGFNGLPRGIDDTHERLQDKVRKLKIIVHAEMNAIMNAARVGIPVKGCTMFIACTDDSGAVWGGPPCTRCTVELIQSGISHVVAYQIKQVSSWLEDLTFARELLLESGVEFKEVRYRPGGVPAPPSR
jgi:dCMP deaminase